MGSSRWLALVVLLAGCATIRGVRAPVTTGVPDTYAAQVAAAESFAAQAERSDTVARRAEAAKSGIVFARRARELNPDGVAGHYYYALNVGWLADADRSYGLNAVGEMETALRRAMGLDERFDFAGPLRMLGILHLRTPPPPVSMGSPRKGLRLLQRAAELFPEYPENQLYLGEALRDNGRADEARAALTKVVNAPLLPDRQAESAKWREQAQELLRGMANR